MKFGLLGERLAHSFSPMIHAGFGDYEYKLYEKKPEELDVFFESGGFDGLNVTIPYKTSVLKYCGSLSETAEAIGSVNTIIRLDNGTLHGDNTDFFGFSYLFDKIIKYADVTQGKVLILGSGGSSLTVRKVLESKKTKEVVVISRTGTDNYENIGNHKDAILIVNTTPVGMYPNNGVSPVKDLSIFKNCCAIIDLIYNPAITELMFQAKMLDIPTTGGLVMLVAQAKGSAERFLRSHIHDDKVEIVAKDIEQLTRNIILIGMPGCGKTTTGIKIAKELSREFTDTDDLIIKTAGKSIEDIITQNGEEAFRKLETEALKELCKRSSLVIATGGGVVTRPENLNIMKQNGKIVYIKRNLDELPTEGRPLSKKEGIKKIAAKRLPLYEKWCDEEL